MSIKNHILIEGRKKTSKKLNELIPMGEELKSNICHFPTNLKTLNIGHQNWNEKLKDFYSTHFYDKKMIAEEIFETLDGRRWGVVKDNELEIMQDDIDIKLKNLKSLSILVPVLKIRPHLKNQNRKRLASIITWIFRMGKIAFQIIHILLDFLLIIYTIWKIL